MQIHALNLYPVKALAGLSLERALLTSRGLALPLAPRWVYDRQWMLINAQGQMITQRQVPALALLLPKIIDQTLCLTAAGHEPMALEPAPIDAPWRSSQVWGTPLRVQACAEVTRVWLERVLPHAGLTLVSLAEERPMLTERFGPASATHFADAAPYLVANTASLDALNEVLVQEGQAPVDTRRFRANIWLQGLPAFSEHEVAQLHLPLGAIRLVDHCQRCSVITVDPERGVFCPNAHPFKTLARLNAMPHQPKAPAFGVNAVFECGDTLWIAVGDLCH